MKRPMNSFMVFATAERKKLREKHPEMHNKDISKMLGVQWKKLTAEEKAPYMKESKKMRMEYEKASTAEEPAETETPAAELRAK